MRTQPKFPLPQPVPATPLQGRGIVACDFNSSVMRQLAARMKQAAGSTWAVIKPHRNSVGIIWNDQVFWWSTKGYYRNGKAGGDRRPFHHILWEHYHGRPLPAGHEIFFRDRDYHNFRKNNLELMTKAELHLRTIELGEVTQLTNEQRGRISSKRWERAGRKQASVLLEQFNRGSQTVTASLHKDLYGHQ